MSDDGVRVDLPAVLGLRHARPVLIYLVMGAHSGFDSVHLERDFRWHTPVDVAHDWCQGSSRWAGLRRLSARDLQPG